MNYMEVNYDKNEFTAFAEAVQGKKWYIFTEF